MWNFSSNSLSDIVGALFVMSWRSGMGSVFRMAESESSLFLCSLLSLVASRVDTSSVWSQCENWICSSSELGLLMLMMSCSLAVATGVPAGTVTDVDWLFTTMISVCPVSES